MPSLEPTSPPSGRKRAAEPDPVAEKIHGRLAELRAAEVNPEDAVEQGLLAIVETTDIAAGAICLFDARQQVLRLAAERGLSDQGCRSLRHIRRGYAGSWDMPLQSLTNRRVYLIENAAQNRYVPPLIDEPDKMRTVLCLPLLTGSTPVGSLIIVSTARKPFGDSDVARLEAPGRELAVIIEAARARARQSERRATPGPAADPQYRQTRGAENLIGQRFDTDQEIIRAREIAGDWERKHQELAGELAAATAREQRLRDELTAAAERLQDFSHNTRGKATKDEAAQLAQSARLNASLAEAEAIASRERMRATEIDRKLTEMAELLSAGAAREEAFRKLLESGAGDADPAKRKEFIDQSLEIARLNTRLADTEAALAQARTERAAAADASAAASAGEAAAALAQLAASQEALQQARSETETRLRAQQETFDTERGRLEARLADLDTTLAETRQSAQTVETELAAVRAREQALQDELAAAAAQHQRLLDEANERERQREQARSAETAQLQSALRDAHDAAQRATERLAALEQRHQDVAGQLAATSTREQALREELESSARTQQARAMELEALLEHERLLVVDWQRKHEALEAEVRATAGQRAEAARQQETAEATAAQDAQLGVELEQLRARLTEVETNGARDAARASEWQERCAALTSQLDDVVARNAVIDRELGQMRGQLAARSANAAAAAAEKEVETETLGARLAAAEAARAAAEQAASGWAQRHDALAAEFEATVARADDLARALEAVRADTASDRVAAEGARAAAQVDAETTRAAMTEARQTIETLTKQVTELRETVSTLEGEADKRTAELAAALAAQTERAIERLEPTPAPKKVTPPPASVRPVAPAAVAPVATKTEVRRIAVVDDPTAWKDVKLHGVETVVLAPTADLADRLATTPVDRVLVNLAARGAFDALLGVRAAGASVPFCGCLVPPGLARGLALGFVEVVHAPLDPDEVTAVLGASANRGTRVLTAGADADAFISLRQALARQGMSVSMAWDGKQASDLLQMVRPEIVVMDLDIPPRSALPLIIELTVAPIMPLIVLLPGRQDVGKRAAAELADPGLASRLLPPDRLLDEVRRSGRPKG